jgi:5-hydroxyisourate hydrolase-like protein (transthyretin family)
MKRFLFITALFLTASSFAKKWDAIYISKLIAKGSIDKVIQYYEGKYYSDNRDPQDAFKIAELYVKKKEYDKAMQWYNKESQLINSSKINLFNYAYACQLTGQYQKALDAYLMYAALTGDVNKVMDLANQCERIIKASVQSDNFKIENYSYNTADDEVQLAMLRNNPVYITHKKAAAPEEKSGYTILQAVREYSYFAPPIKAVKSNALNLTLTGLSYTRDGNKVVFAAKPDPSGSKKPSKSNEQLYVADNLGGNFLNIMPLPFNQEQFTFKQPSFNSDGTVVYFASNQPGGAGGFDIWKSVLINGSWIKPINLGKLLNSAMDELSPFIVQDDHDNLLYFSSDRAGGFGGFDIYTAAYTSKQWQDVTLQPAPVNSAGDDISIIYDKNINTGYVASNRSGGKGGFDIYRFIPFDLKLIVSVTDVQTSLPLDYAYVKMSEHGSTKILDGVTDGNGRALFQVARDKSFSISVTRDNYQPVVLKAETSGKNSTDSVIADVQLKQNEQFSVLNSPVNQLSLENYITFTGKVVDASTNKPVKNVKMRMVNYTTNKMREVDIDKDGRYQLKLLINNTYKVIFESPDNKVSDELATYGLEKHSVKVKDYVLSGSKFTTSANKVYTKENVPAHLKVQQEDNNGTAIRNTAMINEPITQEKIDSLKKVIAKDEPQKLSYMSSKPAPAAKNTKPVEVAPTKLVVTEDAIVEVPVNEPEPVKMAPVAEPKKPATQNAISPEISSKLFDIDTSALLPIGTEENKQPKQKLLNKPEIAYKIQIGSFMEDNMQFPKLSSLGKIEKINSYGQYIYRLGDYYNLDEAKAILEAVRAQNYFVAFILQFTKGKVSNIIK